MAANIPYPSRAAQSAGGEIWYTVRIMKIGFLGAGKMAHGILSAMTDKDSVILSSVEDNRNVEVAQTCELVFLAVRPQDVDAVAAEVRPYLTARQTVVSIVAGKTIKKLRASLGPKVRLIRVMPNLALRAGAGMCAVCPAPRTPTRHVEEVERILGGAGVAVRLKEKDFDAVTALSGSGPAYFAYMEEAMAEGGVALGLKPSVARLLAEQTMYGTAKFLRETQAPLRAFIGGVCTKGGTTEAGMRKLAKPAFKRIVAETLAAAARRSRELAN